MEFDKKTVKKLIFILFITILFYLGVKNIVSVAEVAGKVMNLFFPFILGAMVAFIINVPMSKIENLIFKNKEVKGKRIVSFLLTILLVAGIIAVAVTTIVPQIADTLVVIAKKLPEAYDSLLIWAGDNLGFIEEYLQKISVDWPEIVNHLSSALRQAASVMVNSGIVVVSNIIGAIVNFCIGLVFAIYILMAKENLTRQGKEIIYAVFKTETADKILYVCSLAQKTFSRFISGQCLEACILGFMFFVTMSVFRIPYAMLISVLIAFSALIPIVGAFIGCAVGILLILMVSPVQALIFLVMFLVLQQIEGNFVYPHVVGSSVGLPSMWVLVAVTIGGKLMGVAGMIIFIPLISVLYTLFSLFIKDRLKCKAVSEDKWLNKTDISEEILKKDCNDMAVTEQSAGTGR